MDNLRGTFDSSDLASDSQDWDAHEEEETVRELPPEAIGQDERRMQVRAYNHWASLLGDRTYPCIEDLEPHNLPDFGPNSVLLDFSGGIDDPTVQFLGEKLADECGAEGHIDKLSDVPPRSLLSRITDHYMQILANEAPIGFEAEFVNQRGASIMYRGILLPYSSDDETIDFIYGVINWKEIADQVTSDELLLEIDQALELDDEIVEDEDEPHKHHADPVTEWADSPAAESDDDIAVAGEPSENGADIFELDIDAQVAAASSGNDEVGDDVSADNVAPLGNGFGGNAADDDLPMPDFGQYSLDDPEDEEEEESGAGYSFASLSDYIEAPAKKAIDLDADAFDPANYEVEEPAEEPVAEEAASEEADSEEADSEEPAQPEQPAVEELAEFEEVEPTNEDAEDQSVPQVVADEDHGEEPVVPVAPVAETDGDTGLYDCLASARELAETARLTEDRSRTALYAAVGRAYDFSLAAKESPEDYEELIEESGLAVQERAPMTPVVKLVFGADYDKTRLTEYAAVLSHAHRLELERGSLAKFLEQSEGGLKGVVKAERKLRREESGKTVEPEDEVRRALAKKLRELEALTLEALSGEGPEFSLVMVRRDGKGGVAMLGEIGDDIPLIERAAKKLVG